MFFRRRLGVERCHEFIEGLGVQVEHAVVKQVRVQELADDLAKQGGSGGPVLCKVAEPIESGAVDLERNYGHGKTSRNHAEDALSYADF